MAGDISPEQIAKARASGYSDAEIADHLSQKMPDQFKQATAAGYTPTEILDHLGGTNQPVTAGGVAKAAGTGLVRGVEYLAGLPGDVGKAVDWLMDKVAGPATPEQQAQLNSLRPPSSSDIVKAETNLTGGLHTAGNKVEQGVENVASFIPGAVAGPETLVANILKRGVLPGAVSEAAGQATAGTPLEPYARVAGSLVQGGVKTPLGIAPTDAALRAEGGAGSQAVRDMKYATDGNVSNKFVNRTLTDLDARNINANTSPETTAILKDYQNRPFMTAKDYDEMKLRLNASQEPASTSAVNALYDHINSLQPQHAIIGNPADLQSAFNDARGNYAAGMRGKTIENAIQNAEDNAASKNSGLNVGNDIRNTLKPLTKDRDAGAISSGFNPIEIAKLRQITNGTVGSNLIRQIGNRLGGGGGISSTMLGMGGAGIGAAAGGYEGTAEGSGVGLALAALGHLSRGRYNSIQLNRAKALSEMVRSRAPLAAATAPSPSISITPGVQRILNMSHAFTAAHGNGS